MRKFVFMMSMLVLCCALAYGQTRTVSGVVRDEKGDPVPYATITVSGTNKGTQADANGKFTINVEKGETLVVTAVNYKEQHIAISDRNTYDVRISGTTNAMEEVIVTAGGIKAKRKEIGTANTVIKAESLTAGKAVSVAGGLQGKVAGLNISGTGGGVNPNYRVVLRGQRSLTGNNQALIVLDNVIVPSEVLSNLNPEDIEDIVVLNGAGAAALYGSQASNGALIVTTKKGKKGMTTIGLSHTTTIEQVAFFPKIQKKFGSGGYAYGVDANGNPLYSPLENQSYGPAFDGQKKPIGSPLEDGRQDSAIYAYNDGHFKFWEKGITNQTDFNLATGDDKSTFYMSGQYAEVTGTTPGDKYNRTAFRINGTRKIGEKVIATYTTAYTQNRYDITTETGDMYTDMLNMPSNVDITRYKNWRTDPFANPNGYYNPWYLNPYFVADNWRSKQRNDFLIGNLELRYSPVAGLDLVARQGITAKFYTLKNTVGAFAFTDYAKHTPASSKSDIAASVTDGSNMKTQLLTDFFAQYRKSIHDYSINFIGGTQITQNEAKYVNMTANGLVVPDLYNVSNGVGTPVINESNYLTRQIGVYGDLRIGYKGYLYLHGTGRNDWVSTLAPNNRSFFYPSVDLSFIASDAIQTLKESNTISYLKLRAGWSKVGQVNLGNSDNFGAYYLLPTYSSSFGGFPYGSLPGYTVGDALVSNNLRPEITKGYEAGFDLNMFKDRFTSNVTIFSTKTDNQTVSTNISSATGFTSLLTNTGQTQSQGLEVTAHVTPIKNKDWMVTVGGNYTYLNNNVNFISAQLPRLSLATYGDGTGSYAVAGYAFPVIMGYDYKRDPQGHVIVDRLTGLPSQSDTISILGNAVAKNRVSLDGTVKYKNFSLSFLFEYRGGYKVYNSMGRELDWSGTGYRTAVYDRKSFVFPNSVYMDPNTGKYVTNTNVAISKADGNNGFWTDGVNRDVTANYVTSGDFWKLRELSLAYDLPASIISKTKVIKGARISVQGRNLLMWMAKDNYYTDPEYSDAGNDNNGIGLTGLGQTPPSRYYGATISVKF
jgi:TonB-linked SusC/RagA family outer membrane protein